jgi:hypothetical protein
MTLGLLLVAAALASGSAASGEPVEGNAAMTDQARARLLGELVILKAADVAALTPDEALDKRHIGKRVRWAGGVYAIDGGCLTINFARSGDYGEPRWTLEPTYQAFVACGPTYDADLVQPYTNVTIIGRVTGKTYIGMGGGGTDGATIAIEKLYRWSDCLAGDANTACKQGFLTADPMATE